MTTKRPVGVLAVDRYYPLAARVRVVIRRSGMIPPRSYLCSVASLRRWIHASGKFSEMWSSNTGAMLIVRLYDHWRNSL